MKKSWYGDFVYYGNIEKGWKKRFEENIMFYFYSEGKKLRLPIKQIIYAEILNHDLYITTMGNYSQPHDISCIFGEDAG